MDLQPFWENIYADDDAPSAFGEVAPEIAELAHCLPPQSRVLDLGSGEGRNALFLAAAGHHVSAVDISAAALSKLKQRAVQENLRIRVTQQDLCHDEIEGEYELIIAHGCLHLLPPPCRDRVLSDIKAHTREGGYNVVVVFTDEVDPPADLRPWMVGLFKPGEIFTSYAGWLMKEQQSYILEDEHPGGIHHRHAVNKLVAQRSGSSASKRPSE